MSRSGWWREGRTMRAGAERSGQRGRCWPKRNAAAAGLAWLRRAKRRGRHQRSQSERTCGPLCQSRPLARSPRRRALAEERQRQAARRQRTLLARAARKLAAAAGVGRARLEELLLHFLLAPAQAPRRLCLSALFLCSLACICCCCCCCCMLWQVQSGAALGIPKAEGIAPPAPSSTARGSLLSVTTARHRSCLPHRAAAAAAPRRGEALLCLNAVGALERLLEMELRHGAAQQLSHSRDAGRSASASNPRSQRDAPWRASLSAKFGAARQRALASARPGRHRFALRVLGQARASLDSTLRLGRLERSSREQQTQRSGAGRASARRLAWVGSGHRRLWAALWPCSAASSTSARCICLCCLPARN